MFSRDLIIEKNKIKNQPEQKIKKQKNLKSSSKKTLSTSEQIDFFAEIIVNNLLKDISHEI